MGSASTGLDAEVEDGADITKAEFTAINTIREQVGLNSDWWELADRSPTRVPDCKGQRGQLQELGNHGHHQAPAGSETAALGPVCQEHVVHAHDDRAKLGSGEECDYNGDYRSCFHVALLTTGYFTPDPKP